MAGPASKSCADAMRRGRQSAKTSLSSWTGPGAYSCQSRSWRRWVWRTVPAFVCSKITSESGRMTRNNPVANDNPAIRVENLERVYHLEGEDIHAINAVTLDIWPRQMT